MTDGLRIFRNCPLGATASLIALLLPFSANAQDEEIFNDIEAGDELQEIALLIETDSVDVDTLNNVRTRVTEIDIAASACAEESNVSRTRLEERFEPLRDLDLEASPERLKSFYEFLETAHWVRQPPL